MSSTKSVQGVKLSFNKNMESNLKNDCGDYEGLRGGGFFFKKIISPIGNFTKSFVLSGVCLLVPIVCGAADFSGTLKGITINDPDSENSPPSAVINYTQSGDSFSFDGTGSIDNDGVIAEYRWDFGDGSSGTGSSVTHQFSSGSYPVTLTVVDDAGGVALSQTIIANVLETNVFDSNNDALTYSDDAFATQRPLYAEGDNSAEGFQVTLGGVDTVTILDGMSGGWSGSFTLSTNSTINGSFTYRLVVAGKYEGDECGQARVAIDNNPVSFGSENFVAQLCGITGSDPDQDSGWKQTTFSLSLSAGNHSVTIGGWNNKKTYSNEIVNVYFDNIVITAVSN